MRSFPCATPCRDARLRPRNVAASVLRDDSASVGAYDRGAARSGSPSSRHAYKWRSAPGRGRLTSSADCAKAGSTPPWTGWRRRETVQRVRGVQRWTGRDGRAGHPASNAAQRRSLRSAEFVTLRPRVEGEHPVPALREWQRLKLRMRSKSPSSWRSSWSPANATCMALVPRSMERVASGVRSSSVHSLPKVAPIPIKLIWHGGRDTDPALAFLRKAACDRYESAHPA